MFVLLSMKVFALDGPWAFQSLYTIPAPSKATDVVQVQIELYVDYSSKWARAEELNQTISKASKILRQCGVELGNVRVNLIRLSPKSVEAFHFDNPMKGSPEFTMVQNALELRKPAFFLLGENIPSTAKVFSADSVKRNPLFQPLEDVGFVTFDKNSHVTSLGADQSYSSFAHELAHLLGVADHVDEKNNLMSGMTTPKSKTGNLTPTQCQAIRQNAFRRALSEEKTEC